MEAYFAHFPKNIDQDIERYATEVALKHSRYIFTRRKGRQQYGYCTHCKKEYKTDLRHNEQAECPACHSLCTVKASGLGRKTLVDEVYFVYYRKSLLAPEIITAQGYLAVRDYTGDYHDIKRVKTQYLDLAAYIFEPGKGGVMLKRQYGYYSQGETMQYGEYAHTTLVFSFFTYNYIANIPTYICVESIKAAVKDTPFQYSTWWEYASTEVPVYCDSDQTVRRIDVNCDMTKFFDLYSKYPCIEYLTKLGFSGLVEDKLAGSRTYSAVNWRGKNLFKVLKLSKQELQAIKKEGIDVSFKFLKLLQLSKKDGSNFSVKETEEILTNFANCYLGELERMMQYAKLRKITTYIGKQCKKDPNRVRNHAYTFTAWQDYIKDCLLLDLDLHQEAVLFPSNLYQAHQNTIKQVKINENEVLDKQIQERVAALKKYCMTYHGLFIRPAESTSELIDEGKVLHHCVGTYTDKYALGNTTLLFLRQVSAPNTPFYTVEIRGNYNSVFQVRGKHNCPGDENPEVAEFIEVFTEEKLTGRNKSKNRIPA